MSHLHGIGSFPNAAAEYQAYLEQLRAARRAITEEHPVKGAPTKTFDSEIDPEDTAEGEGGERADEEGMASEDTPEETSETVSAEESPSDDTGPVGYYA